MLSIFSNPGTPTSQSFIKAIINKDDPEEYKHDLLKEHGSKFSKLIRVSFIGLPPVIPLFQP